MRKYLLVLLIEALVGSRFGATTHTSRESRAPHLCVCEFGCNAPSQHDAMISASHHQAKRINKSSIKQTIITNPEEKKK